jgi:predicted dehydrogenase
VKEDRQSMSRKIGYAVVGLGVGVAHVESAAKADNAELLAVCDLVPEKLQAQKEKHPTIDTYESFAEMLKRPDIECVSIATPSGMHAEMAIMAMRAGKHVLIEKPIEITIEKAMSIEKVRLETGRKVGCVFQNRATPLMTAVKKAIQLGQLGRLITGSFHVKWYRNQEYYDSGGWRGTWAMDGGGALMNQSVHTVDLMQWFMGNPVSVFGHSGVYCHEIETEDMSAALVKFDNGAVATFVGTTCSNPDMGTEIQLNGSNGVIYINNSSIVHWRVNADRPEESLEEDKRMKELFSGDAKGGTPADLKQSQGHNFLMEDMCQAILDDRDPFVTALDAIKSVSIVCGVYDSWRTGRQIIL